MNIFVSFTLLIIFILVGDGMCFECDFFTDLQVEINPKFNQKRQILTINGCLEPKQFSNKKIDRIAIENRIIGILGDHAIHNLTQLKKVRFTSCDIRKISSNAFENLPSLQEIWITESKLTSIEPGIFNHLPSLEIIVLNSCRISKIAPDAFGPSLRELSLNENMIREINHLWFANSTDIINLFFRSNKIKRLTKKIFQNTQSLEFLDLSYNEIFSIEPGTFRHTKHLDVLDLGYNKLVKINPTIIPVNFKINDISLNNNLMNFLPQSFLDRMTARRMDLSGNPWECACLDEIKKWMIQWHVEFITSCKLTDIPYCVTGAVYEVCSGKVNATITKSFLKETSGVMDKVCVNLS